MERLQSVDLTLSPLVQLVEVDVRLALAALTAVLLIGENGTRSQRSGAGGDGEYRRGEHQGLRVRPGSDRGEAVERTRLR